MGRSGWGSRLVRADLRGLGLHALEMPSTHLAVAGMVVKLHALLRIVSDCPERPTHVGAGGFLPSKNDTAIGLDGSVIVATKENASIRMPCPERRHSNS